MCDNDFARIDGKIVFVTGAGGFIGSALVKAMLARGAIIRALVGAPGQQTFELPAGVIPVFADIEDRQALATLARDALIALHLAGAPSVAGSFETPQEYERVHVGGTLAVLEACRLADVPRFVYVSSADVYGRPAINPVTEDHPLQPRSPYAASKAAAEHFVHAYVHAYGLQAFVLRPFSVYGPGLPARSLLGTILRQVLREDEVVLADLAPVRDYVFVDDVVDGVVRAAVAPAFAECTFNLGSGSGTSVGSLADLARQLAGRNLPIRSDPSRRRPANTDIYQLVADPSRAGAALGWSPTVSLVDGLLQTLQWMETHQ